MSNIDAVTYYDGAAITASDGTDDPAGPFAALQATTAAGTASVIFTGGSSSAVTVYLPLGVIVPVAVRRVRSTGTTATGVTGLRAFPAAPPKTGG